MGEGMDLSWIKTPHEYEPRRVYSTTATDWQLRVDFDPPRVRTEAGLLDDSHRLAVAGRL